MLPISGIFRVGDKCIVFSLVADISSPLLTAEYNPTSPPRRASEMQDVGELQLARQSRRVRLGPEGLWLPSPISVLSLFSSPG